jgi:hypothetical protein
LKKWQPAAGAVSRILPWLLSFEATVPGFSRNRRPGAVIAAPKRPTVNVYTGHFLSFFWNLVGNAIKYRGEFPSRIQIT